MKKQMQSLAALGHGIEYLEDTIREYKELYEMLADEFSLEDIDIMQKEIAAGNSLASGMRFLEMFKKGGVV